MYFKRLYELRCDNDLTQQQVADYLVCNRQVYARYEQGKREIEVLYNALEEILELTLSAMEKRDMSAAALVEPLEQVIDYLKKTIKMQHVIRLKNGQCTIEVGFVLNDILTCIERTSDHCSNIAACILDMATNSFEIHEYLRHVKDGSKEEFNKNFNMYMEKYALQI